jgi:Trk K+ transport system NAD-binding subunit
VLEQVGPDNVDVAIAASNDDGRNLIAALEARRLGVIVPERARVAGKTIREIDIPMECVVAVVIRGKNFVVPRGGTRIEEGDEVIFVGPTTAIKKAHDHFILRK